MELALYHPDTGYYARAAQRSGRAGDFFTSVDVGPLFGELLEVQVAEMVELLATDLVDLVEAAAGNGRLSADILRATRRRDPRLYDRIRLHLVEASAEARAAQVEVLGDTGNRLASSSSHLPASFTGVLFANELLDALPVHQVVMTQDGLREIYVDGSSGSLRTIEGPPSTPELSGYLNRVGIALEPGWRGEINLRAVEWIRNAAARLRQGFIIVIDYGHEAGELYSVTHSGGTLTTFTRHVMAGSERSGDTPAPPAWLEDPGERDITSHVDFTAVRLAGESVGLATLGFLDQTYFLMGLGAGSLDAGDLKRRLALKTLLMPGGLGSTHKVLIFGKDVGTPFLVGCSYRVRVT
jgi:SAM-dependent MidA family methyltransferase